jgi:hypothetical protein
MLSKRNENILFFIAVVCITTLCLLAVKSKNNPSNRLNACQCQCGCCK